jgi:hypothetical protein
MALARTRRTFCVFDKRYSKSPYCCDFVFTSEDLLPRVRSIEVDGATQASDHQPVSPEPWSDHGPKRPAHGQLYQYILDHSVAEPRCCASFTRKPRR